MGRAVGDSFDPQMQLEMKRMDRIDEELNWSATSCESKRVETAKMPSLLPHEWNSC